MVYDGCPTRKGIRLLPPGADSVVRWFADDQMCSEVQMVTARPRGSRSTYDIPQLAPIRKKRPDQSRIDSSPLCELPWKEIPVAPCRCPVVPANLCLLRRSLGLSAGHSVSAEFRIGIGRDVRVVQWQWIWCTNAIRLGSRRLPY